MKESRRQPRVRVSLIASCEGARGRVRGSCTNLSLGGAFFDGAQLPIGSRTTLTLEVPGQGELTAPAEVRHHTSTPVGMGMQFVRLEPAQVQWLTQLCSTES